MGYANATITLDFPDLSDPGDLVYVTIRNPRILPLDLLTPPNVALDAEGRPVNEQAAVNATYEMFSRVVFDWHVYDGLNPANTEPLPLPATADHFRLLPVEIIKRISDEIGKVTAPPQ